MSNVTLLESFRCNNCHWPIIHICCNENFLDFSKEDYWDWWVYCSNKSCKNHYGSGIFQELLDWFEKTP